MYRPYMSVLALLLVVCCKTQYSTTDSTPFASQSFKEEKLQTHDDSGWIEDSPQDLAVQENIENALFIIGKVLKRGQILTLRDKRPTCVFFKEDARQNYDIDIYELVSAADTKRIQPGKKLEHYQVSNQVILSEPQRCFWYDTYGNIDFVEPDQILRYFDNPPQGDIVVFPQDSQNPRRGVIDIIKRDTGLQLHQFILQNN